METKAIVTEHNLKGLDVQLYQYKTYHRLKIKAKDADEFKWTKSVTRITGILDKPGLPGWAVDQALKYIMGRPEEELPALFEQLKEEAARKAFFKVVEKAPDRERDKAALIGKQAHEMANLFSQNRASEIKTEEMHKRALACFNTLIAWASEHEMESRLSEQIVGSLKFDFAGLLDNISFVKWEGKKVKALIDYKTGKKVWPSGFAQLGGYLQAYKESFQDETIEMCFILNFQADGSPMKVYPFTMDEMKKAITFFGNLRRAERELDDATKMLKKKWEETNNE